jgi:hypothetical protein
MSTRLFHALAHTAVCLVIGAALTPAAHSFESEKVLQRGDSSLGAKATLTASDVKTPDSYTVKSQADVEARLLSTQVPAATAAGSVTVAKTGSATVHLRLVVEDETLVNYARTFQDSTAFSIPSYVTSNDVTEKTVMVGPVPIKVKGVANFSSSGSGRVDITPDPAGLAAPTVQSRLLSEVKASAFGTARSLKDTVSATFTGSAKLANASLKTAAKLYPGLAENQTNADYRVDWALGKAEGNLRVNALLKLPFGIKKSFSKSLGKFLNSSASGNLASGTTTLE